MVHLLNLLAAIALLVWGTQIVRTGILRVFGENLRHVLAVGMGSRVQALLAGVGVTSLIQSSTATCLIVISFLGRSLVTLSAALAVMLGADVGTALMAVVFSLDLSWLSPLLIFGGVVAFIAREKSTVGQLGRVAIGLGLILLSLQLIVAATRPLTEAPAVRALLAALPQDVLLDMLVGAVLAVLSYSSLAIVLLVATLAVSGIVPVTVALGLVLGANLGSGLLAVMLTAKDTMTERRLPIGNLLFKIVGALCVDSAAAAGPRVAAADQRRGAPAGGAVPPGVQRRAGAGVHRPDRRARRGCCSSCSRSRGPAPRSGRSTWTRRRWPRRAWPSAARRARRCTRPTWWRPCCAASCRCCAATTSRWPSSCARWTTPSTSSTPRSSCT